jgi:spore coat polysaccharide biosynthesis protein SpsF (cytidylyltransferase family)
MNVAGEPMILRQLERLERARFLDDIIVATTTNPADDDIVDVVRRAGAGVFRGGEHDVLRRYANAAREARADVVVRVTADCPLLDPGVVDRVIDALGDNVDYATNVVPRTFPQGLDVEALHRDVLMRLDRVAASAESREHVTWFVYRERSDLFVIASVTDAVDNSDLRWTVDDADDLERVRRLYADLDLALNPISYTDVVAYVRGR